MKRFGGETTRGETVWGRNDLDSFGDETTQSGLSQSVVVITQNLEEWNQNLTAFSIWRLISKFVKVAARNLRKSNQNFTPRSLKWSRKEDFW